MRRPAARRTCLRMMPRRLFREPLRWYNPRPGWTAWGRGWWMGLLPLKLRRVARAAVFPVALTHRTTTAQTGR